MGSKITRFKQYVLTQTADIQNVNNEYNLQKTKEESLVSYLINTKQQKPVSIDFKSFLQKKYYKQSASERQLQQHLEKLKDKEDILKSFKYHEDFDRIDNSTHPYMVSLENSIERSFKTALFLAFIGSRITTINLLKDLYSNAAWKRHFWGSFIVIIPYLTYIVITSQENQIQNHQFFRSLYSDERIYYNLDQKLNLYKYNQDIKYNFQYPSTEQYLKVRDRVNKGIDQSYEKQAYAYYKELANIPQHKIPKKTVL